MLKFVSVILAVAVFTGLALADLDADLKALDKKIETTFDKCNISSMMFSKVLDSGEISNKVGCFIACCAKEFGIMNADNKFDKEKIYKILEPVTALYKRDNKPEFYKPVTTVLNGCLETQTGGSDSCEAGKKAGECILAGSKKVGLY